MQDRRSGNRLLLAAGALGPMLFVVVFLVEGATRRGYSPVRHQVSLLSLGHGGWIQITNFVVSGLLLVCFSAGLRQALRTGAGSASGPILVATAGVALII